MESFASIFGVSFVLALSGAVVPGPMLTVVIRESVRRGPLAGPMVVVGHSLLEVATVAAILVGLGGILAMPLFFGVTGVVGGSILIYMGVSMVRGLGGKSLDLSAGDSAGMNPVAGGVVASISNPYFYLWWATAGVALLSRSTALGIPGQVVFFGGHVAGDMFWYLLVSCMLHFGRSYLTDFRYRVLLGALAAMIVGFGLFFVWEGGVTLWKVFLSAA